MDWWANNYSNHGNIYGSERPRLADLEPRPLGEFVLAAHAHSYKNSVGIHGTAHGTNQDLTLLGWKQAKGTAVKLAQHIVPRPVRGEDFVVKPRRVDIWHPPIQRCEQTALAIVKNLGKLNIQAVRRSSHDLAGVDLGPFAGLTYAEMSARNPEFGARLRDWLELRNGQIWPPNPPGGEPTDHFLYRIMRQLAMIQEESTGASLALIVATSSTLTAARFALERANSGIGWRTSIADLRDTPMPDAGIKRGHFLAYHSLRMIPELILPPSYTPPGVLVQPVGKPMEC